MKTKIFLIIATLFVLIAVGFVVWASIPANPEPGALEAIQSNQGIEVTQYPKWLAFQPIESEIETVVVIYPGGRVDYRAYAPAARQIAENGYLVLIMRMPLNLAVFGANRIEQAFDAYPAYQTWVLGGHSLGGAMASSYAYSNPGRIDGLFLWASYPVDNQPLSETDLPVLSISASMDGLATRDEIAASRQNLPAGTIFVEIEGGNHAQFGSYGQQNGDNPATISAAEQQNQIVSAMLSFLQSIGQE